MRTLLLALAATILVEPCSAQLLTLGTNQTTGVFGAVAVDPATGAHTTLVPIGPSPLAVVSGSIAYDAFGQRLFFITNPAPVQLELYTVHIASQVTTHVPLPANSGVELVFDAARNRLLTIGLVSGAYAVLSIDPATGASSVVAPVAPSPLPMVLGSMAFDPLGQRLFFITNPAPGQLELYTVNIATQITTHVLLAPGSGSELLFDPVRNRLLTLGIPTGTMNYAVLAVDPATGTYSVVAPVSPSPFAAVLGSLAYDAFGQRFFVITNPALGQFTLHTVNLTTQVMTSAPLGAGAFLELIFAPSPAAIPTLSMTGSLSLIALLAVAGVIGLRQLS